MRIYRPLLIVLLVASGALAQESNKPAPSGFEKLTGHCEDAKTVIESERKRLGANFEKELLKYLGEDADRHYWVGCSLQSCCNEAPRDTSLELLSLLIRQQALSLLRDKKDNNSRYTTVSLHILAAVQSQQLGFHTLAIEHKSEAEWRVSENPDLKGAYPAMTEADWKLYDSLSKRPINSRNPAKRRQSRATKY